MSNPISSFYKPTMLGSWLGANGPAVYTDPNWKESVAFILNLGVKWIRMNTAMEWITTRPDSLTAVCNLVSWATSQGAIVLPVISGAPDSYRLAGGSLVSDAGLDKLPDLLRPGLEALYTAGVRVIESQNEWDGPGVNGGANVDVPRTVQTHRLVYETWHSIGAKHHDGDLLSIPGGTSTAAETVKATQAPGAFSAASGMLFADLAYKSFLGQRGSRAFDMGAHHAGAYPYNPHDPANVNQQWNGFYQTQRVAVELQAVCPGVRVAVTEIPWPDDQLGGEAKTADRASQDLLHMVDFQNRGLVGPVIVYHGCRDGAPGHDNSVKHGIRRPDGTAKPVCATIQKYAAVPFTAAP